jgi:hypothetical protein
VVAAALVLVAGGGATIYLMPRWRAAGITRPAGPADAQVRMVLVRRAPDARVDAPPVDATIDSAIDAGRRRRTKHPRRPRDGGVSARPDARATARPKVDARPRVATRTELLVTVGPWCDVLVDGRRGGRSPMHQPIPVTPGRHTVVCRQGEGGAVFNETVVVKEGQRREVTGLLTAQVKVRLQLSRGDAVRVVGLTHRGGADVRLAPKRYRVDLLKGGAVIDGGWVTIAAGGCTLYDTPELSCR